jgi:hypothetical protein
LNGRGGRKHHKVKKGRGGKKHHNV